MGLVIYSCLAHKYAYVLPAEKEPVSVYRVLKKGKESNQVMPGIITYILHCIVDTMFMNESIKYPNQHIYSNHTTTRRIQSKKYTGFKWSKTRR